MRCESRKWAEGRNWQNEDVCRPQGQRQLGQKLKKEKVDWHNYMEACWYNVWPVYMRYKRLQPTPVTQQFIPNVAGRGSARLSVNLSWTSLHLLTAFAIWNKLLPVWKWHPLWLAGFHISIKGSWNQNVMLLLRHCLFSPPTNSTSLTTYLTHRFYTACIAPPTDSTSLPV